MGGVVSVLRTSHRGDSPQVTDVHLLCNVRGGEIHDYSQFPVDRRGSSTVLEYVERFFAHELRIQRDVYEAGSSDGGPPDQRSGDQIFNNLLGNLHGGDVLKKLLEG